MANTRQNSRRNKSPSKNKKKKTSYKINDFHYRFDGNFKQEKKKSDDAIFIDFECTPENVHDIATNVFGKTYYISVGEM